MPDVPGDSHRLNRLVAGSSCLHATDPATEPTVNLDGVPADVPCPVSPSCGTTNGLGLSKPEAEAAKAVALPPTAEARGLPRLKARHCD
jgi:hypothetical protein